MANTNPTILSLALALAGALGASACKSTDSPHSLYGTGAGANHAAESAETGRRSNATPRRTNSDSTRPTNPSILALPTGDPNTSAILIEKVIPNEALVGTPYSYEIVVTNLTDLSLGNVVITEQITGFTLTSSTPPATSAGVWRLGSLGPNDTRTIEINGTPQSEGQFSTCTGVTYDTSLCMTIDVGRAGISLKSGHSPDFSPDATRSLCDPIEYVYEVCNPGTGTTTNVIVNIQYASGMTTDGQESFLKSFASLAPGQCETFKVPGEVSITGSYTHSASVTADGGLHAKCPPVTTTVRQPELTLMLDAPELRFLGREIAYEITVKNVGDMVSTNTILECVLATDVEFASASDGGELDRKKVAWEIGNLAPGSSKRVTLRGEPSRFGNFTISATATGDCVPRDPSATAVTNVEGRPAIKLEVVDLEDPIEVGDEVTYVITVMNQGSANDSNIEIRVTIPPNTSFVSASGDTSHSTQGAVISFAKLEALEPKAEATWRVVVRGNSAADARFRVEMDSDALKSASVIETEATNFYE